MGKDHSGFQRLRIAVQAAALAYEAAYSALLASEATLAPCVSAASKAGGGEPATGEAETVAFQRERVHVILGTVREIRASALRFIEQAQLTSVLEPRHQEPLDRAGTNMLSLEAAHAAAEAQMSQVDLWAAVLRLAHACALGNERERALRMSELVSQSASGTLVDEAQRLTAELEFLGGAEALEQDNYMAARIALVRSIDLDPTREEARTLLRESYLRWPRFMLAGNTEEETSDQRKRLQENLHNWLAGHPDDDEAWQLLRESYLRRARSAIKRDARAGEAETFEAIQSEIRAWIRTHPDDEEALQLLREMYLRQPRHILAKYAPRDPAVLEQVRAALRTWLREQPADQEAQRLLRASYLLPVTQYLSRTNQQENTEIAQAVFNEAARWVRDNRDDSEAIKLLNRAGERIFHERLATADIVGALRPLPVLIEVGEPPTIREASLRSRPVLAWGVGKPRVSIFARALPQETFWRCALSRNSDRLVAVGDSSITLFSTSSGTRIWNQPLRSFRGRDNLYYTGVDLSPSGDLILTGASDGEVRIYRGNDGGVVSVFPSSYGMDDNISFLSDGEFFVVGGTTHGIYRTRGCERLGPIVDMPEITVAQCVKLSNDRTLLAASCEGYVAIVKVAGYTLAPVFQAIVPDAKEVIKMCFSRDGTLLAAIRHGVQHPSVWLIVWNVPGRAEVFRKEIGGKYKRGFCEVLAGNEGLLLAVGGGIELRSANSGELLRSFEDPAGTDDARAVAWGCLGDSMNDLYLAKRKAGIEHWTIER